MYVSQYQMNEAVVASKPVKHVTIVGRLIPVSAEDHVKLVRLGTISGEQYSTLQG